MKIIKASIVVVLIIVFAGICISIATGARETKVRSSHGRTQGKVISFFD